MSWIDVKKYDILVSSNQMIKCKKLWSIFLAYLFFNKLHKKLSKVKLQQ